MSAINDFIQSHPLASWAIAAMVIVHLAVAHIAAWDDRRKD